MAFTEDLTVFFNAETGFAVSASFGGGDPFNGILSNDFVEIHGLATTAPTFTCASADVVTLTVDGQITVDGTVYKCREKRPDETGSVTVLILELNA